jgi:hypothetical protein
VNSSSQRKHRFEKVQRELLEESSHESSSVLQLVMDVSTRWDSTGTMIIRALRLRAAITEYTTCYHFARPFALSDMEWKKIGYLVDIVRPFNFFTTNVGRTKSITLPYTLSIYDVLFERLTESRRRLEAKVSSAPWVQELIDGINSAEVKLDKYYNKVYTDIGSLYGIGALLNPKLKLDSFNQDFCWLNFDTRDWAAEFEFQLRTLYGRQYDQYERQQTERLQALRDQNRDPLALLLDSNRLNHESLSQDGVLSEVDEWLSMRKYFIVIFILIEFLLIILYRK